MKALFIAASLTGAAIAGIILYMGSNRRIRGGFNHELQPDKRVDGQVREMKYSMG